VISFLNNNAVTSAKTNIKNGAWVPVYKLPGTLFSQTFPQLYRPGPITTIHV